MIWVTLALVIIDVVRVVGDKNECNGREEESATLCKNSFV